jgi:hypothetical protein
MSAFLTAFGGKADIAAPRLIARQSSSAAESTSLWGRRNQEVISPGFGGCCERFAVTKEWDYLRITVGAPGAEEGHEGGATDKPWRAGDASLW